MTLESCDRLRRAASGSLLAGAALLAVVPAFAQAGDADDSARVNSPQVTIGESAEVQDPLAGRAPSVPVRAERVPTVRQVQGLSGLPSMQIKLDPRVLGVAPGEPMPGLRREGEALRKRDGRLLPAGDRGYAVFIAEPDVESGDEQPVAMVVAPCMTLESMERLVEDRGDDLRFTVTGVVHTYRGVNYLLPTSQPRPWLIAVESESEPESESLADPVAADPAPADPAAEDEAAELKPDPVSPPVTNQNSDQPTLPADDATAADERLLDADEVLLQLLEQRNNAPRLDTQGELDADPDAPAKGADPSGARRSPSIDAPVLPDVSASSGRLTDPLLLGLDPDQPQAKLKDEGEFIIARAGRLIRSANGSHALFVLDADGRGSPEPPLIVHACKLLETMEKTVLEQGDNVPFVITGQVFVYRGANYLLPTIVTREFDRGNLE